MSLTDERLAEMFGTWLAAHGTPNQIDAYNSYFERVIAPYLQSRRQSPSAEWQGIETAPRDGTVVLAFWPPTERHPKPRYDLVKAKPRGLCLAGHGHTELRNLPTHWQPLPNPPNKESEHG